MLNFYKNNINNLSKTLKYPICFGKLKKTASRRVFFFIELNSFSYHLFVFNYFN
jgi:hypothetical protein